MLTDMLWWFHARLSKLHLPVSLVEILHAGLSSSHEGIVMKTFNAGQAKIFLATEKVLSRCRYQLSCSRTGCCIPRSEGPHSGEVRTTQRTCGAYSWKQRHWYPDGPVRFRYKEGLYSRQGSQIGKPGESRGETNFKATCSCERRLEAIHGTQSV